VTSPRLSILFALLLGCGVFLCAQRASAMSEKEVREKFERARQLQQQGQWEIACEIYGHLLRQNDPGLGIREHYHEALRRTWQIRRHKDDSYNKEVLSIEFGQALRLAGVVNQTMLDGSVEKKKVDPSKVFRKGLDELDKFLSDPAFVSRYVPQSKQAFVGEFRAMLRKTWGNTAGLTRKKALEQICDIAMAAEWHLGMNPTVVTMEFACGACYAADEYTAYLTPAQFRELVASLAQTESENIGLFLRIRDTRIVVFGVAMDSPAAGLINVGDEIVSVDKEPVTNLPLRDVKRRFDGAAGTAVEVEYLPAGEKMTKVARLQRRAPTASVFAEMLFTTEKRQTDIGYIKITGFAEGTAQDVDTAMAELLSSEMQPMKRLIVDLRQNNGGVFQSAIDTAHRFLPTGVITTVVHQDSKKSVTHNAKNPNAWTMPLIVLVDGDTASAAEVLAGALKENDRAFLIGQTTYGKGCTQRILELPNATGGVPTGGMKLTVSRFFSPKGNAYTGRGVIPHLFIDERFAESESMMRRDLYIQRAVEELNRGMSN